MDFTISALVGGLTGILSGFGIGGGSLLMLYLTLVAGFGQRQAGGVNLLYFLACAPFALYTHIKNGLIDKSALLWCVVAGVPASLAGAWLAGVVEVDWIRRAFGVLLVYVGIKEIFTKNRQA